MALTWPSSHASARLRQARRLGCVDSERWPPPLAAPSSRQALPWGARIAVAGDRPSARLWCRSRRWDPLGVFRKGGNAPAAAMSCGAFALMAATHRGALRIFAGATHFNGLRHAARLHRCKLSAKKVHQFRSLGSAFGAVRHMTASSLREFLGGLAAEVNGFGGCAGCPALGSATGGAPRRRECAGGEPMIVHRRLWAYMQLDERGRRSAEMYAIMRVGDFASRVSAILS